MSDETGTEQGRSSASVEFASVVLGELQGRAWSLAMTPERTWNPVYSLEDLIDTRVVCVVPRTVQVTRWTRGSNLHQPICEIGIMFKPDIAKLVAEATTDSLLAAEDILDHACDQQVALVEEIVDHFASREGRVYRTTATRNLKYTVERIETPTLISHEYLEQFQQATSVVRLTGRVVR